MEVNDGGGGMQGGFGAFARLFLQQDTAGVLILMNELSG